MLEVGEVGGEGKGVEGGRKGGRGRQFTGARAEEGEREGKKDMLEVGEVGGKGKGVEGVRERETWSRTLRDKKEEEKKRRREGGVYSYSMVCRPSRMMIMCMEYRF
jgi:hypothetical protein